MELKCGKFSELSEQESLDMDGGGILFSAGRGAVSGGMWGATLGSSVCPGIGTVVGGFAGAVWGGGIGALTGAIGSSVVSWAKKRFF